jgi:uncharacterized metal-binding protein
VRFFENVRRLLWSMPDVLGLVPRRDTEARGSSCVVPDADAVVPAAAAAAAAADPSGATDVCMVRCAELCLKSDWVVAEPIFTRHT